MVGCAVLGCAGCWSGGGVCAESDGQKAGHVVLRERRGGEDEPGACAKVPDVGGGRGGGCGWSDGEDVTGKGVSGNLWVAIAGAGDGAVTAAVASGVEYEAAQRWRGFVTDGWDGWGARGEDLLDGR